MVTCSSVVSIFLTFPEVMLRHGAQATDTGIYARRDTSFHARLRSVGLRWFPGAVKLESQLAWKYESFGKQRTAEMADAHAGRSRHRAIDAPAITGRRRLPGAEERHPGERLPAGLPWLRAGDRLPARHEPHAGARGRHPLAGGRPDQGANQARGADLHGLP